MSLRTKINNPNMTCSQEARSLLSRIADARERGDWMTIQRLFRKYDGTELPVFHAVIHAAFSCGKYRQGAAIYARLCSLDVPQDGAAYATAVKIFAKLGSSSLVRKTWAQARKVCPLDEPLAAARIDAAAAEGDIRCAAELLDEMNRTRVKINIAHVTSAIRACWEAEGSSYTAAEYLLNMSLDMGLQPNIATFTSFMGAHAGANLSRVLTAYRRMRALEVEANNPFTEVYLTTVLNISKGEGRYIRSVTDAAALLRKCSPDRIEAAKAAVAEFREQQVSITSLGQKLERGLRLLESAAASS